MDLFLFALFLWVIGTFFTYGYCFADQTVSKVGLLNQAGNLILSVFAWPLLLGFTASRK